MRKIFLLLLILLACIGNAQTFRVSIADSLKPSTLDGRLLLLLSKNNNEEPRFQVNDGAQTQLVFGMNVDQWSSTSDELIDVHAFGYPIERLNDVPAGDYYVQVLLHKY